MRKFLSLLTVLASPALAQTPAGVINAPIYATGYISQAGGTNVTTNIPAQPNHPANQNIYTTGAITGTWTIKLPNPAFEGQVLSFNCGADVSTVAVTSSDGSSLDSAIPTSCNANSGFVVQFDIRSNIWRNLGSNATILSGVTVNNNTQLTALPSSISTATRLGYASAGDAPPVLYTRSNSACSLNAGAGDGGYQVPTSDGKCWVAAFSGPADARVWGAKCDGTTDDAVMLAKWASALSTIKSLYIPAFCKTTVAISFPAVSDASIIGPGASVAGIVYSGANTTNDIVTIGAASPQTGQWNVSGWTVKSTTTMSDGAGIHAKNIILSRFNDIVAGGQSNPVNLYHGIWFDAIGKVIFDQYEISAIGDGVRVNGTVGAGAKSDLLMGSGKISGSGVGLHIGGGFGGLTTGAVDIINNNTNVLIDNALAAEANRELFFGSLTLIDTANTGCGVDINETGTASEWIDFTGGWIATSALSNVCVRSTYTGIVKFTGGTNFNSSADGINNASASARVIVSGTHIRNNAGYGINNSGASSNAVASNVTYVSNGSGETTGMVSSATVKTSGTINAPCFTSNNASCADFGKTWQASYRNSANSQTLLGISNGTVGSAASAGTQFTGGTSNSSILSELRDNSGNPYFIDSFGSGVKAYQTNRPIQSTAYAYSAPTAGGTVTITDQQDNAILEPAGTLATLTVVLPTCSSLYDGKIATISTTQTLTALTVNATAGTVGNPPTTLSAGGFASFQCRGGGTKWYRRG